MAEAMIDLSKRVFEVRTDGASLEIARCEMTPLEVRTLLQVLLTELEAGTLRLPKVNLTVERA